MVIDVISVLVVVTCRVLLTPKYHISNQNKRNKEKEGEKRMNECKEMKLPLVIGHSTHEAVGIVVIVVRRSPVLVVIGTTCNPKLIRKKRKKEMKEGGKEGKHTNREIEISEVKTVDVILLGVMTEKDEPTSCT